MSKDRRLGDEFPNTKDPKWGSMEASRQHTSDEYESMDASDTRMSNKYNELEASPYRMSEKYEEMNTIGNDDAKWNTMQQEGRVDPYYMSPNYEDKDTPMKKMTKEEPDNRVSRREQHTEFGNTREL